MRTGESPADRPAVRINQLGYLPAGPKRATWVTAAAESADFVLHAADGSIAFRGRSAPWPVRPEPTSGQSVQVLDFSSVTEPGTYQLRVNGEHSHPFRIAADLYGRLSRDALRFFYLLRSGCPVDERRAPGYGRPAGHAGRAPNRGDVAVPPWSGPDAARWYPGWSPSGPFDVSGGWYDAGDYGKYTTSGSIAVWQLLNLLDLLRDAPAAAGPAAEPEPAGVPEAELVEECRWQLDWLLRMQVPPGEPLAGLAFHRVHGTEWSPLPGLPHQDPTRRVLHRPSTTATLHLAAVAAQGARLLRSLDRDYADRLLTAARTAHRAAHDHPVLIAPDDEGAFGGGPYGDPDPADDFLWAAAELWLATGEDRFRREVLSSPPGVFELTGFDFHRVAAPAWLDLATTGSALREPARDFVLRAAEQLLDLQQQQPWGQPYAPDAWDWGSNGRILNNLVVLATAHRITGDGRFRDAVAGGADYLFGRNALGQSYVTGYGSTTTSHLRTRQFGHDLDPALPRPPAGAVAGGANSTHTPGFPSDPRIAGLPPQQCYLDEPTSETTNDICIRWNAPLAYIAAYLSAAGE